MAPAPSSAGRSAVVGTFEFATEDGQDGSDGLSTVLGRPISDIVKRVVTVKQVQPFRLAGPGHGYAKRRRGAWSRRREESSLGSARAEARAWGWAWASLERRASGGCLGTERR